MFNRILLKFLEVDSVLISCPIFSLFPSFSKNLTICYPINSSCLVPLKFQEAFLSTPPTFNMCFFLSNIRNFSKTPVNLMCIDGINAPTDWSVAFLFKRPFNTYLFHRRFTVSVVIAINKPMNGIDESFHVHNLLWVRYGGGEFNFLNGESVV